MKNPIKALLRKCLHAARYIRGFFTPVKNIILFESHPDFSDNTKAVFDEMVRRGLNKKYIFVWWVQDKKKVAPVNAENIVYIDQSNKKSRKEFNKYATNAKCIIVCNKSITKYLLQVTTHFASIAYLLKYFLFFLLD